MLQVVRRPLISSVVKMPAIGSCQVQAHGVRQLPAGLLAVQRHPFEHKTGARRASLNGLAQYPLVAEVITRQRARPTTDQVGTDDALDAAGATLDGYGGV